MELKALIAPKRAPELIAAELGEWNTTRQTAEILRPQLLPSEEAAFEPLHGKAVQEAAQLEAERRFLGRLDLEALLSQQRQGPAPRWFLYDPMAPCDSICWRSESKIVFETFRAQRQTSRLPVGYDNPFPRKVRYTTRPILLPCHVREMIRALRREEITSYVLFEPRLVESEAVPDPVPVRKPDPALVVEVAGAWFVVTVWDDPAVEDPRALHTLREFYVSLKMPSWMQR